MLPYYMITRVVWKILNLNMKMALLFKTILVLQLYMFCKILVKIVAISLSCCLTVTCTDVSVFVKKWKNRILTITITKIYELWFELINYSPYLSDLISNDFFLFSRLKVRLGGHRFFIKYIDWNDSQTITERLKWLQFSQISCKICTIVVLEWFWRVIHIEAQNFSNSYILLYNVICNIIM